MTTEPNNQRDEITKWARELNSRIIMLHHAIGERMGLSATEHKAADILRRFGPMTAGELADQTGLTTGAVTGLVDRLEREGFVKREHDRKDRRRVIIKPVERGKYEEVQNLFTPILESMTHLYDQYSDAERKIIADFALKAAEALKEETRRMRGDSQARHSRRTAS